MMDRFDAIAKVVVVGDTTVGKTCLILRYSQDIFRESFLSTIGVDFKTKAVEQGGKRIKIQLWDTAGQERYDSIRKGFYRGAKGILVVYDITKSDSFSNVTKWLGDITENTSRNKPLVLGLIGNKSDLENERQVPTSKGAELATSVKATFGEVSAKTGHKVNEVIEEFVQQLVASMMNDTSTFDNLDTSVDISNDWTRNDNPPCCSGRRSRRFSSEIFEENLPTID